MCSGRVDLRFVLRAFSKGLDGVFIGGCHLNECNYITHGNFDALNMVMLCHKIMERIGLNPQRLRIEFMSGGEGNLFAEVVQDFGQQIKALGPLGRSEGLDLEELRFKLEAVERLVPYLKLVESRSLRPKSRSKEGYQEYYQTQEYDRLFETLVGDQLAISQILLLLQRKPHSTSDIAGKLGLNPSEVSQHMKTSSRQGLVRYDLESKRYRVSQ